MELEGKLGYTFQDKSLLEMALTHPSHAAETRELTEDNQRLEFLGDSVLQLLLTERLYRDFGDFAEGILTPMRSRLVSGAALAKLADSIDLGDALFLGKGEELSGGRRREKSLADAFEAVIGAIYLDGGLDSVKPVIERLFKDLLQMVAKNPTNISPKGSLQIELQALSPEGPIYSVEKEEGPDHERIFHVVVTWQGCELGRGAGLSKKAGETAAAASALEARVWEK